MQAGSRRATWPGTDDIPVGPRRVNGDGDLPGAVIVSKGVIRWLILNLMKSLVITAR